MLDRGLTSIAFTASIAMIIAACGPGTPDIAESVSAASTLSNGKTFANDLGKSGTFNPSGNTDLTNEFFQDLGTNGRRCVTCHAADQGWTIRPDAVQELFDDTDGTHPIFRTNDGSNSPTADVSTVEARRAAYSMLLTKGLIRVGIGIPAGAEFELIAVDDPYGHASAAELSLFRRPLPSANLPFLNTVMWDGRETFAGQTLNFNLADQANGATVGHAAASAPLTEAVRQLIVGLEIDLFNAQAKDDNAKQLDAAGARGGPEHLANEPFDPNDTTGNVRGFDLYDAWDGIDSDSDSDSDSDKSVARASIVRGQAVFNDANRAGRCLGCHDAQNIGTNTRGIFFNIGISAVGQRTPDLPLYTLRNVSTGEIKETTDPGRALITGLWRDVDRFKAPNLRGLAARAPYFHNGSAATLDDLVDFYEQRFNFTLTAQQQSDLVAFLGAL